MTRGGLPQITTISLYNKPLCINDSTVISWFLLFSLQNQNPLYQSPEMKYENIAYGRE